MAGASIHWLGCLADSPRFPQTFSERQRSLKNSRKEGYAVLLAIGAGLLLAGLGFITNSVLRARNEYVKKPAPLSWELVSFFIGVAGRPDPWDVYSFVNKRKVSSIARHVQASASYSRILIVSF
ncbi:hypothetical protein [Cohnella sp. REN36]|uniref:hypothetical protein n=1 Tax=Cohnella sp. REN36 TaxID=2887347 RepID=UPI00351CF508